MEWVKISDRLPSLSDRSVLVHFENGSMETVHVEDYFKDITNGYDDMGELQYTKWYINHDPALTHWMELEPPKDLSLVELIDYFNETNPKP